MQAVIPAAGESSRFWPLNKQHKSLFKIMGRPLIWQTINGLQKSGIREIIIVQGPKKDIENELKDYSFKGAMVRYVVLPKPEGTGSAVWQARPLVKGAFLVVGPHKIDIADYLPPLLAKYREDQSKIILLGASTIRPQDYGMMKFEGKKIAGIVENPSENKEPSNIKTTETYIFPADFWEYYERVSQTEDNLIAAINLFIRERGAEYVLLKGETVSLKYPWDLFSAQEYLLKNRKKKIHIGKNCQISRNCSLRGLVSIGDNCRIGNYVEIKNSIIGDNTRIPHLSYIGDSIIGSDCNLGAGTITANLRFDKKTVKAKVKGNVIDTGREKFGCVMGDNTQTGINVSLMPGVLIGSECVIGPGTSVFENIEDSHHFSGFHKHNP